MKLYLSILVALFSTASVGLAQAPCAATITGKIHNPPAREIEFDYEGLELEDFTRQADQRRQDEFEWLAKGREQYALSTEFIDYATARFNLGDTQGIVAIIAESTKAAGD